MVLDTSATPIQFSAATAPPEASASEGRLGGGGAVLLLAGLVGNLVFGASTLALPDIAASLDLSTSTGALVVSLYSVGFAATLVLGGRLGDRVGRRAVLRCALAAVAITSVAVAAAPNLLVLAVARTVQGLASGLLLPQVLSTIQHATSGRVRARWTGLFAAVVGAGTTVGQLGTGALVALAPGGLGWRLSFAAIAVVALAVLSVSGVIPATRAEPVGGVGQLDVGGAVLLGLAVTGIVLPLGLGDLVPVWGSAAIVLVALLLLAGFALWECRADPARALMPPVALRSAPLRWGLALTFLFFAGYGSFVYYFSATAQSGLGLSTMDTALLLLPFALGFIGASVCVPGVLRRWRSVPVMIVGAICQAITLILTAVLLVVAWPGLLVPAVTAVFILLGAGQALMYGPLIGTVMNAVSADLAGLASGLFATVQQLGLALGVPLSGLILSWLDRDPAVAFAACAAAQIALCVGFWGGVRRRR